MNVAVLEALFADRSTYAIVEADRAASAAARRCRRDRRGSAYAPDRPD